MNYQNILDVGKFNNFQKLNSVEKQFLNALILGKHSICYELVQTYLSNKKSIKELYEDILKILFMK